MKKIFLLLVIIALSVNSFGQDKVKSTKLEKKALRKKKIAILVRQEEEGVIAYKKHFLAGIKLTTDGYGAFIEKGLAKSVKKSLLFQLDITERKHSKEDKQAIPGTFGGSFVYGKINYFYPVKLGVQEQFLLGNKGNKNGVSISANIGGGLTLGLIRPYMLAYDSAGSKIYRGLKPTNYDSARFLLLTGTLVSGPNFGTGFNKLKVNPGAYAKAGVRFDYGKYNETLSALEVGLTGEFYSKKIPQVIFSKENNFFFTAYIALIFGKRK
ncbi:MAG: hypothetical protein ABL929_06035 [Ferruginibacter sp.]